MFRSNYPQEIDYFEELYDVSIDNVAMVRRYQELLYKPNRTVIEDTEMNQLREQLKNVIMTAEKFNKLQDSMMRIQQFLKMEIEDYIDGKQIQFTNFVNTKQTETHNFVNTKQNEIENFTTNKQNQVTTHTSQKITEMNNATNNFIDWVELKKDDIQGQIDATEAGQILAKIGNLNNLRTVDKTNLVNALNEVFNRTYYEGNVAPANTNFLWIDTSGD